LHTQFIGEVLDIKADETVLDDGGLPLIEKIRPLIFSPSHQTYYSLGEYLGKAFSIGKGIKARL
jgi:flavin reductase (DIM6/NTAB) family NADH-FMN oxidoreductase RutF